MQRRKENSLKILESPRSREACNNNTTLLQGITKIGSHRAMKNHQMALHEETIGRYKPDIIYFNKLLKRKQWNPPVKE
jgi:hypothetical protein